MLYGRIAGVERQVSRLIQGTLLLGSLDDDRVLRVFDAAYAAGCNAFETALVYAAGRAEQLLGRWARGRAVRDDVVLIDKGCHPAGELQRMNPGELERDVLRSLENLGTDRIDLYLLHRDDPRVPVDEIVAALAQQRRQGRIRAYGASNWTQQRLQQANDYARRAGLEPFAASSPELSLAQPVRSWPGCLSVAHDREALAWYGAQRLPLLAWSPLASGFLTGRVAPSVDPATLAPGDRRVFDFYASPANFERLERLTQLSRQHGISVAEAALAYVLHVPADVYAVLGCCDPAEVNSAVSALKVAFMHEELAALEAPPTASAPPLAGSATKF